jgi:hypothetical protein
MNVLVIPEDFRKDQYLLRPIVQAMLQSLGRPSATVRVLTDPLLGGIARALSWSQIDGILTRYRGMVDLFLLVVDRDGDAARRDSLDRLEQLARPGLAADRLLLAENAWQEIEVWGLAGQQNLPGGWNWADIRAEPNPKEVYFMKLCLLRGLLDEPGQGRRTIGREAAARYGRVRQLCPEDVEALHDRVRAFIETHP